MDVPFGWGKVSARDYPGEPSYPNESGKYPVQAGLRCHCISNTNRKGIISAVCMYKKPVITSIISNGVDNKRYCCLGDIASVAYNCAI